MALTFVADESIETEITRRLREKGFTVHSILELCPGSTDIEVLALAVKNNAILITNDKDFGDLVNRNNLAHCGIILLRLRKTSAFEKALLTCEVIKEHESELASAFTVITPLSVRIRKE